MDCRIGAGLGLWGPRPRPSPGVGHESLLVVLLDCCRLGPQDLVAQFSGLKSLWASDGIDTKDSGIAPSSGRSHYLPYLSFYLHFYRLDC